MTKTGGFGERLLSPYKGLALTHTTRFPRSANRWRTASPTRQLLTRNLPLGLSTRSIAHRRARLMCHEKRTGQAAAHAFVVVACLLCDNVAARVITTVMALARTTPRPT